MEREHKYCLADSTLVEPLINQWAAWAHLVSPVPASLHLINYQIKTMQSFLESPETHLAASYNPSLVGGPFIALPPERVFEIRELMEYTERKQKSNIELAKAVLQFYEELVGEATGQCLEPYYERIPEALGGYVELVYDYFHRPTIRFFEGLLYESDYYDTSLQSLRVSKLDCHKSRHFFMSTPRLREPEQIHWHIPFDRLEVDELFRLDIEPQTIGRIEELLGMRARDRKLLRPLLTDEPAHTPAVWNEPIIRFRYFGHACVLMEWNDLSILTDPYVGVRPVLEGIGQLSYCDLPRKIDYVLITHNHQDHFALETLLRLRHRVRCVIVPKSSGQLYGDISLKLMLRKLGFRNVVELDTLESIELPDGEIVAVPFLGEHGDLAYSKCAYTVRAGRELILFAADSDCLDLRLYEHLRKSLGDIETVFLGMECVGAPLTWSSGPLFPTKLPHNINHTRRYHGCDSRAAHNLLKSVGARRAYNYAMGMEPWLEYLLGLNLSMDSLQIKESDKLLAEARDEGFVVAKRLFGKDEFYLNGDLGKQNRNGLWQLSEGADVGEDANRVGSPDVTDADNQFVF